MTPSPIIIGAGHNGLIAACYLARAGMKPLVLERRPQVGGGCITDDIHPGFRCPTLSHEVLLHLRVVRELNLERHVSFLFSGVRTCALAAGRPPLVIHEDVGESVASIRRRSAKDADAYPAFIAALDAARSVLATVLEAPPPNVDEPGPRDLWRMLNTARRFRALDRRHAYRLLRWIPMPVADMVEEWFDDSSLQAAIAAPGLSGALLGPRSAGSTLVLLLREAHRQLAGQMSMRVQGGPGALSGALAAAAIAAGAEIRTSTAVERILVDSGRVTAVVANGQEIPSGLVLSAADPKTTYLRLVNAADLPPTLTRQARHYRVRGTVAKINLALSSLPSFNVDDTRALSGHILCGADLELIERAFDRCKYGAFPADPWLEVTIPSILDPGLCPAGTHVASIYVHYAPMRLKARTGFEPDPESFWSTAKDALLSSTLQVLERYAPDVRTHVVAAQVITPEDLEQTYGFAGGHIFHGELTLDQLFVMRPLLGFARYESPIEGLYTCGGGTHPGGFLTGASGRLAAKAILRGSRSQNASLRQ